MSDHIMKQAIHCECYEQMVNVIAVLVQHGLTFRADASTNIIELTGGY